MRIKLLLLCLIGALLLPTLASAEQPVRVQVMTSKGRFIMELYPDKAPKTVENFLTYARNGYYDGTIFHRVIESFMIQGGGFTEQLSPKGPTLPPIMNEADNGLSNERYSVSMARTNAPHSATAQFFINTRNNVRLDYTAPHGAGWGYCVFGKVLTGQKVIDEISKVRVKNASPMFQNVPTTPVIIQKVVVIE